MTHIYALVLSLYLATPAFAQTVSKGPLSYSMKEYGFVLAFAMLGGLVRWYTAVRKGVVGMFTLTALIGELVVSAFAGLLAFFVCESFGVPALMTAAAAGVAGHAGTVGLAWVEKVGQRWVERRFGATAPAPLGKD